jgi:hypothetical protein
MRRVRDFRIAELRIPASMFPLPKRVEELLRVYGGLGRWEGNVAVFEVAITRVPEIEQAFADVAGDDY